MKPVNLTPTGSNISTTAAGPSNQAMIFGIVGVVAVIALGGYFAMAHVSTVKEQTANFVSQQATSDSDNQQVLAQLAELGQKPTTLSWDSVAVAYMKDVTDKAAARTDFPRFVRDLSTVLTTGSWFVSIKAGADATDPSTATAAPVDGATAPAGVAVLFDGYARNIRDVNTIISNLNALSSMEGAELVTIETQRSLKGPLFRHFTISANLVAGGTTSADGSLVADGGVDGLALDPKPVINKPAVPKVVVAPDPLGGLVRDTGRAGGAN